MDCHANVTEGADWLEQPVHGAVITEAAQSLKPGSAPPGQPLTADRYAALLAPLIFNGLQCAFQPIVDINTGAVQAVEALVRGFEPLGYDSPYALLDAFADAGQIVALERSMHRRAIEAFARSSLGTRGGVKLFLNIDTRALSDDECPALLEGARAHMAAFGQPAAALCWELSERHKIAASFKEKGLMRQQRAAGVQFAADDFGQGYSEFALLLEGEIDYIKIDRHFVAGVGRDDRRRVFLLQICRFAHLLGLRVIAEGVETRDEFLTCRELGCDLAQGWFIARPQADLASVPAAYHHVADLAASRIRRIADRGPELRQLDTDDLLSSRMQPAPSVREDADIEDVFELFRVRPDVEHCVVVNRDGEPKGVVLESTLRPYAFNRFGRDLLRNDAVDSAVRAFVTRCPVVDARQSISKVLDAFMLSPATGGVIVTEGGKYAGVLPAVTLLAMANEIRLRDAVERNPLTLLPGNSVIANRIGAIFTAAPGDGATVQHVCYFDFDSFKPFNDQKGFRLGDRAIILFAETLRRWLPENAGAVLGHLGGDDFVAVLSGYDQAALSQLLTRILAEFAETVSHFFKPEEREQGFFEGEDRYGTRRRFRLLRCSAAVLEIESGSADAAERLDGLIAAAKSAAKASVDGVAWRRL